MIDKGLKGEISALEKQIKDIEKSLNERNHTPSEIERGKRILTASKSRLSVCKAKLNSK